MKPYLKVFYLTMNVWRPVKDERGWTFEGNALKDFKRSLDALTVLFLGEKNTL